MSAFDFSPEINFFRLPWRRGGRYAPDHAGGIRWWIP